ncbi:MAG: hypothetical protein JKY56_10090, partial [Kofleriaceae bacterium]|nr:hypothetical protein [Kofleriaceae bacterium]
MRWFCLGLMFWFACGGDPKAPETSVKPAVFELIDEGSGEANVELVWPLNAGSYMEGSYSVESKHGDIYRVLLLETPRAFIQPRTQITDVQRWTKSEYGLALVSSVAEGEPSAPLVILPASIRNGMSWRTSDGFIASVTTSGQQDTIFGSKTTWTVTLVRETDGYMLSFVFAEGLGPQTGSLNSGVVVVGDDSSTNDTFQLPSAQTPTLFDSNTPRVSAGIYDLGAIDVEGAPFVFTARAFYKPVGAQAFDFRDADHCMLVEPSGQLTTTIEEAEIRIPSVGTCPVNVFPGLGDSRLFSSPALATPIGSGGVLWFKDGIDFDVNGSVDVAYSLPHFVDGVLRAFERVQLNVSSIIPLIDAAGNAVQSEIFEIYRTTHTAAYDDAAEGHLRIGMDFDSESAPLRYLTVDDAWITANTIEGSQPQLGGESWFIPGRHSVRTHDDGREVLLARIDGVVLKIDTDGDEVRSSIVAHAAPVDDGLFTGAVRHPSGIALSVNVPESIVSTVPFVKVPAIDTDFDLPSSFAFRAQRHGNGFLVCYPKRFAALADLKLRAQGQDAMAVYQSGFVDGCGLVTFENELPQNTAIEATLPEVGRILASTDNIINVVGTSDLLTIPLRGGGFVAPRFSMDDVGLVTEISEVPRISVGDGRPRFRDLGGHGYWIYTTDENGYVTTLRLSNVSGVSWPTLPFRAQTVSNNLTFKS